MKCIRRQIQHTALHWILSPEVPVEKTPVPLVEDLLLSGSFLHAEDQDNWLRTQLKVTEGIINTTAEKSKGQRNIAVWAIVRKLRITASNFGQVLKAARRKRMRKSLLKRLLSAYNLDRSPAILWGITNERAAIDSYIILGAYVEETGVWLHESGAIGADGAVQTVPGFFLETADGYLHLKAHSDYYHQIQGQLYITKKKCCDLIVWTPTDLAINRNVKDINWSAKIDNLIDFYFQKFIPEVKKK
ncbi:uncharacterized protein LOC128183959 [Crassostrea angulata]|uniref:uncharacterized protein LOC128183959 n=1 Tax=Magallana angulata TaxID=2784310 RepID=UPI0022B189D2|nr:uncharacterized protein LOC128183959 [Crassostrea angulata]